MNTLIRLAAALITALAAPGAWSQSWPYFPPPNSTVTAHAVLVGKASNALGSAGPLALDTLLQGQGATSDPAAVSLTNCGDSTHALAYSTTTHAFSCQSIPDIATPVVVNSGGTGDTTLTAHGVLLGEGTANVSSVAAMAADTLLQGQGATSDPAAVVVNNCGSSTQALSYSTSTHTFGCQTLGATTAAPATIPDLVYWFKTDSILGTNAVNIPTLGNSTPWLPGPFATLVTGTVTVDTTQLNSLNVLKWPGAATGRYALSNPVLFNQGFTLFAVVKPAATTNQTLLGAANSGLQVDVNSGASGFDLTKSQIGVIAASTTALTAGTWVQINATLVTSTAVFAFRVSRAAAGSGTGGFSPITGNTNAIGYNSATNASDLSSSVAEVIIYNRVLSGAEISTLETYLNTKWGV